ncbi:MAG TPA: type II toxin-antitoxin system HicA family toxin [Spirochaetales bacterium]|nr:type II toxin-antitoxin system HicA family toxin [Spirochaetales bacterium]
MPLSGKEMLDRYLAAGWILVRIRGSHARVMLGAFRETIPLHRELHRGIERALLKRLESVRKETRS